MSGRSVSNSIKLVVLIRCMKQRITRRLLFHPSKCPRKLGVSGQFCEQGNPPRVKLKYISKSYGPFGSCDVRRHSYGANHQRKYSSPSKPKFHPAFAALIDTSLVISSMILLSISSTASRIASNSPKRRTTSPNSTWLLCVIPNPRSSKSVRGGCCCVTDTSQERLRTPTRSPAPGYSGFNFNGYYRCAALIGIG